MMLLFKSLPQIIFDIAGELGFLGPAVALDDLTDITLHVGHKQIFQRKKKKNTIHSYIFFVSY